MSRLRALLIALTILAMACAPLLVPSVGLGSSSRAQTALAAPGLAPSADNHDDRDDDDDGRNDNNDDDNGGDDNDNRHRGDNDNEDDNDNDEDDGGPGPVLAPRPAQPAPPPPPLCSTPGQDMAFQSADGRVTVQVFASMTQSVKFSIRHPIDPASVPPPPGQVVGGLLFQLIAETCDGSPIAVLPAEVNLGVRYSDADAAGLNEASFTLARLNTNANAWQPAAKQAADPANNYTSATITEMGYYVLYPRP